MTVSKSVWFNTWICSHVNWSKRKCILSWRKQVLFAHCSCCRQTCWLIGVPCWTRGWGHVPNVSVCWTETIRLLSHLVCFFLSTHTLWLQGELVTLKSWKKLKKTPFRVRSIDQSCDKLGGSGKKNKHGGQRAKKWVLLASKQKRFYENILTATA